MFLLVCILKMIIASQKWICLKVGSCPTNEDSVKKICLSFFFSFFCIAFKNFFFLNLLLSRKPSDYAENCHISFIYFLSQTVC